MICVSFVLLTTLTVGQSAFAQGPLSGELIHDLGASADINDVKNLANNMAATGVGLGYRSGAVETREFLAAFRARSNSTTLLAFSDDGVDVWIKALPDGTDLGTVDLGAVTFADSDKRLRATFKEASTCPI